MKKLIIILILPLILLTSCFYAYYPQTGSVTYSRTQPEQIQIYSGEPEQEYIVMGSVAADAMGETEATVKYLKKKAAEMGADAIIQVDLTKTNSTASRTGISGVAVKMKKNISEQSQPQ